MNIEQSEELAQLYKVFGDATRIRIMHCLLEEEMCVSSLSERLDMTQSAISHQLKLLKMNKLVKSRREGKQMYYSLSDDHVSGIIAMGFEHITE